MYHRKILPLNPYDKLKGLIKDLATQLNNSLYCINGLDAKCLVSVEFKHEDDIDDSDHPYLGFSLTVNYRNIHQETAFSFWIGINLDQVNHEDLQFSFIKRGANNVPTLSRMMAIYTCIEKTAQLFENCLGLNINEFELQSQDVIYPEEAHLMGLDEEEINSRISYERLFHPETLHLACFSKRINQLKLKVSDFLNDNKLFLVIPDEYDDQVVPMDTKQDKLAEVNTYKVPDQFL